MNEADVSYLATRLAAVAVELDAVVGEIASLPLTESAALLLTPPSAHLTLANAELGQLLYELEYRGRLDVPPIPLTASETSTLRRAA